MMTINCNGRLVDFNEPKIAGILNITPDSFYDGGCYLVADNALKRALEIVEEGADFIDIGAFSSRPGAELISEQEELDRLLPIMDEIRKLLPDTLISVDTYRSKVAETMIKDYGVCMINDISAGRFDERMFAVVAENNAAYVMMHIHGNPDDIHTIPAYGDMMKEMILYFSERLNLATQAGINDVLIDPGFGFGKTLDQNYLLMNKLDLLKIFEKPIYVGLSRKSMIYKFLDLSPGEVLPGTTALHMKALLNGADILRVHDVKEAVQVVKVFNKLNSF